MGTGVEEESELGTKGTMEGKGVRAGRGLRTSMGEGAWELSQLRLSPEEGEDMWACFAADARGRSTRAKPRWWETA